MGHNDVLITLVSSQKIMNTFGHSSQLAQRIPALDGLRGISIALVIFSHVLQTYGWTNSVPFVWRLVPGATGVSVFFVISGYLISTLLLCEQNSSGKVSLRGFYFRRFFRIVPAYLVYLGVVAALTASGAITTEWMHFGYALMYVTNYIPVNWTLLHTWSLSVEEQFYLLYPVLFIWSRRPTLFWILLGTLLISILARLGSQVLGVWPVDATYSFEGRADELAFGCLVALFQHHASAQQQLRLGRAGLPTSAALIIFAIALPLGTFRTLFFNTLIGASVGLIIHSCTSQPYFWLTRLLENQVLRSLGLISYSLYLWQQIWLAKELKVSLPAALAGALLCGVLSYWFVEKTFLRLRHKVEGGDTRPLRGR